MCTTCIIYHNSGYFKNKGDTNNDTDKEDEKEIVVKLRNEKYKIMVIS